MTDKPVDLKPNTDTLFECIALVAVAKDALHKIKEECHPAQIFKIDLILRDLDKTFRGLNEFYESLMDLGDDGWRVLQIKKPQEAARH